MRLGLGPVDLGSVSRRDLRALAEAGAASSFDSVWVAESRSKSGAGGALAAAAMVARWVPVRVGAVVEVGLYHPLHLAEDVAVADISSAGRLELLLRPAHDDPAVVKEHLHVLMAALSGAHIQWEGLHLRVPARLAENGSVPQRLALNPRPLQPVVPAWLEDASLDGLGTVRRWSAGMHLERAALPELVLCPNRVQAAELLEAAGDVAGYFLVHAADPLQARDAGRRLAGPLRMPEFPPWVVE